MQLRYRPFGLKLRRFLWSQPCLALLPECGWLDGGCLILRDALVQWGNGYLHPGASHRTHRSITFVDHGFAWLDVMGHRLFIDGDGIQEESAFKEKLAVLQQHPTVDLRFDTSTERVVGIPVDPDASRTLAQLLSRRLGGFSPSLLTK